MAASPQPRGAEDGARRYPLSINGKFVDGQSGRTFESINPHNRSVVAGVGEIPFGGRFVSRELPD